MPATSSQTESPSVHPERLLALGYAPGQEADSPAQAECEWAKGFRQEPLSYHQERLWFIDAFEKGRVYEDAPTYHNIPILLSIRGRVDPEAAEFCLNLLVRRHEVLRTRIRDGAQSIASWDLLHLKTVSVPLRPATPQIAVERALEENLRPFSLADDLLIRGVWHEISPQQALLLISVHHAIADLESTRILSREFAQLYLGEGEDELPPAQLTYARFGRWQRQLPEPALNALFCYWKGHLKLPLAPLELPCRRRRDRIHVYRPKTLRFSLSGQTAQRAQGFAQSDGFSLADVFLAQFLITLHNCTRQREILVGTSASGRAQPELASLVGPVSNLLAIRQFVSPKQSFRQVVQDARRLARQAANNAQMPFDLLVQKLRPSVDMSRTALFDVFFQFVQEPPESWRSVECEIDSICDYSGYGKYDLHLTVRRKGEAFEGVLHYNVHLYQSAFASQLAELFLSGLDRALPDPEARIADLLLLPPSLLREQDRLTAVEAGRFPRELTLDQALSQAASGNPDRVAVIGPEGQLTYAGLERSADRLAHKLVQKDVAAGDMVAVALPRTTEILTAIFAVLKCGAVYVPIDPDYPRARVEYLLEDCQAALVVTFKAIDEKLGLSQDERTAIHLDGDRSQGAGPDDGLPFGSRSLARGPAYCIYTSGSTGKPKGCLVSHRNAIQLILEELSPLSFDGSDVWSWIHSFCFDFSVWEIFGALLHAGRLVVVSRDEAKDPAQLVEQIRRQGVTVLNQTPAAAYALFDAASAAGIRLPSLRTVVFGGDVLTPSRLKDWHRDNPATQLVNMYGITETTVHVTCKHLFDDDLQEESKSVGRALPNLRLHLLSDDWQRLPTGVAGEIAVGGEGLSLGYWKRPGLAAERFIPNPFGAKGSRLYLSGDFGRLTFEGELAFAGRRDHQVKIRGHRIELGEVEKAIEAHPDVLEAAVVAVERENQDRALAAFAALADDRGLSFPELRRHLEERLMAPMIPAFFEVLSSLPRNPSGKIDRKVLSARPLGGRSEARGYVAPGNERERILAGIWSTVLKQERVGIHDDFFELGGDSILSIQITARATSAGIPLSPKVLFENPTVHALARLAPVEPDPASHVAWAPSAPLTPIQRWFFSQGLEEPHHFNQSLHFELGDGVTPQHVMASLSLLSQRHDVLGVLFEPSGGDWRQVLSDPPLELPFAVLQLESVDSAKRLSAMRSAARAAHRSLDLERGPLFRVLYFDRGRRASGSLLAIFHHLIIDGVSWRILLEEMQQLLLQQQGRRPIDLGPRPVPYLRIARRMAENKEADPPEADSPGQPVDGRSQSLAGRMTPIPSDSPVDAARNTFAQADSFTSILDAETTQSLQQSASRQAEGGLESALVAAILFTLRGWLGRSDLVLDLETHGRQAFSGEMDASRTLGWFTAFYMLSIGIEGTCDGEAVAEVGRRIAQARKLGLARFLRSDGTHEDGDRSLPPAEICVNFLGNVGSEEHREGPLRVAQGLGAPPVSLRNQRRYWIEVSAFVRSDGLRMRWEYCRLRHRRGTIETLASNSLDALRRLASSLSRSPSASIARAAAPVVEPALPLAPAQAGMLYQLLLHQQDLPAYVIQMVWNLKGPVDWNAFRQAWEVLLARHEALRARFQWEAEDDARQIIAAQVQLPWVRQDWKELDSSRRAARLEALLQEDRRKGFDLREAPLFQLRVIDVGPEEAFFIWNIHHIIVDGWSISLLRSEFFRLYDGLRQGGEGQGGTDSLDPAGRFQDYIAFLGRTDEAASRRFWRQRLRAVRPLTLFSSPDAQAAPGRRESACRVRSLELEAVESRRIGEACRRNGLTVNSLVQGAWAAALSLLSGRSDVIYGVVVSGRPPSVPGVESAVGPFINTVPLPIATQTDATAGQWLKGVQSRFNQCKEYEHAPLTRILEWGGCGHNETLFDTILVCENYPQDVDHGMGGIRFTEHGYHMRESFPLVLEFVIGDRLSLRLKYETDLVSTGLVERTLWALQAYMRRIETSLGQPVNALLGSLRTEMGGHRKLQEEAFSESKRKLLGRFRRTRGKQGL